MNADDFNELRRRIPALDGTPDVSEHQPLGSEVTDFVHALLDCVMQHNDDIRPRYFPRTS
jgi:hypothetical protein